MDVRLRTAPHRPSGDRVMYRDAAAERLIDPRVARYGGTRTNPKSNYDFPGMMDAASWRRTLVHQHTAWYGCAMCGQKFKGPHAFYTHRAKVHDR
jgi:hypothetical protein